MKLLIVIASVREGRSGVRVAEWFTDQVNREGSFEYEVVDLKDVNLPYELGQTLPSQVENGEYEFEQSRAWARQVNDADVVVFVSPEYNHGYPASLKNAVDHLYQEWRDKPVGFVGYGAAGATFSFAAFSVVAKQLGMKLVGPRVAIPEIWAAFNEDGEIAHAEYRAYEASRLIEALVKAHN